MATVQFLKSPFFPTSFLEKKCNFSSVFSINKNPQNHMIMGQKVKLYIGINAPKRIISVRSRNFELRALFDCALNF